MRVAIRKYRKDFLAIVVLVVIGVGIGGYILSNQRLYLPKWVPGVGTDFFKLKAQFSTAQSVTPGQGQTVNIAGVRVGEISRVDLVDGRAVVTMNVRRKYSRIYRDATMLLRPKTGLNDMIIELFPGHPAAGRLKDGATLPVANTLPNVNPDEILAVLDGDTRDYLRLLLAGGGKGLKDQGPAFSSVLRRFKPTGRDVAKATRLVAARRRNVAHAIHNFRLISEALGSKDRQLTQFVKSSNAVLGAFARQNTSLQSLLVELPSTLRATNTALQRTDAFAAELGPALASLRPAARALGPALTSSRAFFDATTPVIADKLRPFTKRALPTVAAAVPATRDLAGLAPDLVSTFKVLNHFFNALAYNPPGQADEGYLFWLAWLNHAGASVFSTADAHGPIRRGIVLVQCGNIQLLKRVAANSPQLGVLVNLLNPPENCTGG